MQYVNPAHLIRMPFAEKMRHFDLWNEQLLIAEQPQTQTEFRIFRSPSEQARVEAADLFKGVATHCQKTATQARNRIWCCCLPCHPLGVQVGADQTISIAFIFRRAHARDDRTCCAYLWVGDRRYQRSIPARRCFYMAIGKHDDL